MAEWEDRVQAHPALASLESIRERLEAIPAPADESVLSQIERIRSVTAQMDSLVADADAQLLSPSLLNIAQAPLEPVPDLLATFAESGEIANLTRANEHLDDLIRDVGWPLAYAAREPAGLRESAANYRRSAGQLLRSLVDEESVLRAKLTEVSAEADSTKAAIDDAATTANASITTAVSEAETRLSALNAEIEAQKTRLATLMSDYNTQFLAGETARTTKADTTLDATVTTAEASFAEQVAKHEALLTESKTAASDGLAEIDRLKVQALTLVNTIGAIGFSGSYGSYAEQEKGPATTWRRIAAGSVILLIAFQLGLVWYFGPQPLTWENLAQRALFSVPFLVLAAYAAAQSGKHAENARAARQRELELAAIDPYLVLLPVEEQRAIKAEAARRMFGQAPSAPAKDDTVGAPQLLKLIEEFIKRSK